jgi:hypothetical protein
MIHLVREQDEIDKVLNAAEEDINGGDRKFPGMSYEEGIVEFWRWLTQKDAGNPMED